MESRINGRVCFAFILTLSLIRLDRGTALWRTPTVAANDTPLLTLGILADGFFIRLCLLSIVRFLDTNIATTATSNRNRSWLADHL